LSRSLTISDAPFGQLVQLAYRAADGAIQRGLQRRGFDVRMTHSAVLANIDIATGTRATVLAQRAAVSRQAIGELIDDLENRGYVRRVADPADGRAKLIQLTRKGHKLIDAAYEVIGEIETALLKEAGNKNLETARGVLRAAITICSDKSLAN
jgi:DNA-binding MarR family transcriptional regulator